MQMPRLASDPGPRRMSAAGTWPVSGYAVADPTRGCHDFPAGLMIICALPDNMRAFSPNTRSDRLCRCGHSYAAHQHYRSGSECSLCSECPRYRSMLGLAVRFIDMLTGRSGGG